MVQSYKYHTRSHNSSIPALEQLELWAVEMERYGMFEVMQWMQDLQTQVADKVHLDGHTPWYGAEWGCDGTDEFHRDRYSLGDNCHLAVLPLDPLYRRNFLVEHIPPLRLQDVI